MNKKRHPNRKSSKPKLRKQKFLSLRLQFPANDTGKTKRLSEMLPATTTAAAPASRMTSHHHNLFPIKSENQVEEDHDQQNVEFLFSTVDSGATSLTSLLNSSHGTNTITSRNDEMSPSSASPTCGYGEEESESGAAAFVRKAMRSRERISSDEKWVCYSEVVERKAKVKVKEEEVTSSAVIVPTGSYYPVGIRRLELKLDYKGILNAWCDKGPLYVHSESSQIVPDINDEILSQDASNYGTSWGCPSGLWTVPTMVKTENYNSEFKMKCEDYELKKGHREASVLRYKEKRHLRLFSKQIRYEVRKLNAQKRPRLKGRFVKTVED